MVVLKYQALMEIAQIGGLNLPQGVTILNKKFMTWRNAKTFCENIGGFLAEIQNPQQQIFM